MSPPVRSGSSLSPLKWGMSTSAGGRWATRPKRESKALAPRPKVIVSRAGSNSSFPALPEARSAAVVVSDRIRSRRPAFPFAVTSSDPNWRYFGCGVTMPAWCGPWKASTWDSALAADPSKRVYPAAPRARPPPAAPARRRRCFREMGRLMQAGFYRGPKRAAGRALYSSTSAADRRAPAAPDSGGGRPGIPGLVLVAHALGAATRPERPGARRLAGGALRAPPGRQAGAVSAPRASSFTFEPLFAVAAAAALAAYLRSGSRAGVPGWRQASFVAGAVLIAGTVNSPLETIAVHYLLMGHLVQNALIADIAPPLLLLGLTPEMGAGILRRLGPAAVLTHAGLSWPLWV